MTPRRIGSGNTTTQITIRLEDDFLERVDRLIDKMSPSGIPLVRADVLRAALARGVDALEAETKKKK